MAILPSSTTSVVRYAAGLYGVKLGNATLQAVQSDLGANPLVSLPAVLNAYYAPFAGKTSAQVAAIVVANAGIVAGQYGLTATNVADAVAIVTTALNSAAPLGNQGVAISNVLAGWSNDSPSDPVYGAAATAWNLKIAQSTSYANAVGTSDTAFGAVVTEFRLTGDYDRITGTSGDDTFIGNLGALGNADRIDGADTAATLLDSMLSLPDKERESIASTLARVMNIYTSSSALRAGIAALDAAKAGEHDLEGLAEATYYRDQILPAMLQIRAAADDIETFIADDLWPLPTYQEMLFVR